MSGIFRMPVYPAPSPEQHPAGDRPAAVCRSRGGTPRLDVYKRQSLDTPKTKILIVDDEMRMRRVITDYLRIKGYETAEAGDGMEALEKFEVFAPDLILLDVMMPRMDGFDVCRHIRSKSAVPIIMLTAKAEEEDELQGFGLGVDEYLSLIHI